MFGSVLEKLSNRGIFYYGELFGAFTSRREIANIAVHYRAFGLQYLKIFWQQRKAGSHHAFAFEDNGVDVARVFHCMTKTPGIHVVKIFPRHIRWSTLEKVLEDYRPYVIFIRRNHYERFVSLQRAKTSGKWARQEYGDQQVEISVNELDEFQKTTEEWYARAKAATCRIGLEFDDLSYRDLLNPVQRRGVFERIVEVSRLELTDNDLNPSTRRQGIDQEAEGYEFNAVSCCGDHGNTFKRAR